MSTRCIIRKLLLSCSAALALALWPSLSRADTVSVLTWTDSTTGLNLNGALNLTNNALIIQATDATAAQAAYTYLNSQLALGFNGSLWTGNNGPSNAQGIYSDSTPSNTNSITYPSAATDPFAITGIGIALNDGNNANFGGSDPAYSVFDGVAVNSNSVLVRFTYNGDTDMMGSIQPYDVNDTLVAFSLDQAFGPTFLTGWVNGDSNYAGTVTSQDVNNVLEAFSLQSTDPLVTPSNPSASAASSSFAPVSVPEPGSVILALTGAIGMFGFLRRRRWQRTCA